MCFESAISPEELVDIQADMDDLRDRFPVARGANVNRLGRKALGFDCKSPGLRWSKPLGDPFGHINLQWQTSGKAEELAASEDARMTRLSFSPAPSSFRMLLCGFMRTRFCCAWRKPSTAKTLRHSTKCFSSRTPVSARPCHGIRMATHWAHEAFDEGIHGFNFMAQVYGSTPVNGVWAVPGTHKLGKIDIKAMVEEAGSERLTDAVLAGL